MGEIDLKTLIDISWSAWSLGWLAAEVHHHVCPDENQPHPASREMIDTFYDTMLARKDDENFTLYEEFVSMLLARGYIKKRILR